MAPEIDDFIYGRNAVREALKARVPASALAVSDGLGSDRTVRELIGAAEESGIEVTFVDRSRLDRLTDGAAHQGVLLSVQPFQYASFDDLAKCESLLVLDGVTDPANLGSMLRSAVAFGFEGVVLSKNRSVSVTPAVRKVAAGAAEWIKVAMVGSIAAAIPRLQGEGFVCVGLDSHGGSSVFEADLPASSIAVFVGSEGKGLSRLVRERCESLYAIPIDERMESLNVAVAAAVFMAELARQRQASGPTRR